LCILGQMNTPEISIIIPAYNTGQYLADSITSVLKQSFDSWELIVVDDGSTDNTAEIANNYLKDQRITLIRQLNKGVSAARNAGIKIAKAKFITFLDADDYYLPHNLQEKYNVLVKNSSVDFVYCDVMQCDEKLNDIKIEKGVETDNLFKKVLLWQVETIPTLPSNIMIKTALMKEHYLFDERLSNCADRYMKILLSKDKAAAYIPKALVKYRNTPGSMSKKVGLLEQDELYIAKRIIEENIIPAGMFRRKVIANMYLIIAGSWYKDAGKTGRAIQFAFMALLTYPGIFSKLLNKGLIILFSRNKK
jgi:glycosyltransferase involved in cell wall biosynthesis